MEDLRAGEAFFVVQMGESAPYEVRFGGPPGRTKEWYTMPVPCAGALYTVHGPALTDHEHNFYTDVCKISLRVGLFPPRFEKDIPLSPSSVASTRRVSVAGSTLTRGDTTDTDDTTITDPNYHTPSKTFDDKDVEAAYRADPGAQPDDNPHVVISKEYSEEAFNTTELWKEVFACLYDNNHGEIYVDEA